VLNLAVYTYTGFGEG